MASNDWLTPPGRQNLPSQDEPESTQSLQIARVDPELERLLEEQEETERRAQEQTSGVLADRELMERAAESLGTQDMQGVVSALVGYMQRYAGSDRAGFYNALRVIAEVTGTELPVGTIKQFTVTTPGMTVSRLSEIDSDYRRRHEGQSIPVFGPTAWEPATVEWCKLIDGTEFICFNHPSRDPAKDR